jgi:hypothetical protein
MRKNMDIKKDAIYVASQTGLSSAAIKDFQKAYYLEFSTHISSDQAQTEGLRFLQFMKHILKPIPAEVNYYDNK